MGAVAYREAYEAAQDHLKIGGDVAKAQAFATLALAEAIAALGQDVAVALEQLAHPLRDVGEAPF